MEGGYTPALARLISLMGADEIYDKAQFHLREAGGIDVDSRQIHRVVQRIGPDADSWQQDRPFPAHVAPAPIITPAIKQFAC